MTESRYPWASRTVRWPTTEDDVLLAQALLARTPRAKLRLRGRRLLRHRFRRKTRPAGLPARLRWRALERAGVHFARPRFMAPRSLWGKGPWTDEPDEIHWRSSASGYPLLMWRNMTGGWCGYVGLPPGHPLADIHYDSSELYAAISVHGGLTFGGRLEPSHDSVQIPPEYLEHWWIGFDCGHFGDVMPAMEALTSTVRPPAVRRMIDRLFENFGEGRWRETYKTVDDVRLMVEDLAEQAAHAGTLSKSVADTLARLSAERDQKTEGHEDAKHETESKDR